MQFKALHQNKSHCYCDDTHDRPDSRLPRSSPPFRCQHKNARNLKCRNHLQHGRSEDECDVELRERIIPYTKAINMRLMAHSSFRSRLKCHVYGISISCEANFPGPFWSNIDLHSSKRRWGLEGFDKIVMRARSAGSAASRVGRRGESFR